MHQSRQTFGAMTADESCKLVTQHQRLMSYLAAVLLYRAIRCTKRLIFDWVETVAKGRKPFYGDELIDPIIPTATDN